MGLSAADISRLSIPDAIDAGLCFHAAGQLDQAEVLYRHILSLDPNDADGLHLTGLVAHLRGENEKAVELIGRAIAADATFAGYHNNLGEALRGLNRLEEAEQAYREAIRLDEQFPEPHNNLGLVLQHQGQFDEAARLYGRAIQLEPKFAEAFNNLGTVLAARNLINAAMKAYQQAIQLKPDYADAYGNLAGALVRQGAYTAALECSQRALKAKPNYFLAHRHLAVAYERLGQRDKAIAAYQDALRCQPDEEETRYCLAAIAQEGMPATAPVSYVQGLFDCYAERFDSHLTGTLKYRAPELVARAVGDARPAGPMDVLDLGCGTGLSGAALRPYARSLVGVDLSAGMIAKARERQIYDELIVHELTAAMTALDRRFDLIVACDVFVYIGDLGPTFAAAAAALRAGGLFAFSVEADDEAETYRLSPTRRYTHALRYIGRLAADQGLVERSASRQVLRIERGKNVEGWIVVLQKPASV
jgi:predicted TPR repeat methyltransferase